MIDVQNYTKHFISIWEKSSGHFPDFPKQYNTSEKILREAQFDQIQQQMQVLQQKANVRRLKDAKPESVFFPIFRSFLQNVFDFEPEQLNIILSEQFRDVSKDFFYKARAFGPELSPENIYQGLRNVWIMNGLQLMMNIPVEITPSIFAYSMIYPYSDNYLDNTDVSDQEKKEFSKRFNERLHGEKIASLNHTEKQLFYLVSLFEKQYIRQQFPEVFEGLYAIQKGQTDSLKLLNQNGLTDAEIRRICFEKGGASVLADGYLVAGKLTKEKEQALFGYGIYLQLLDDIQDIKEDATAHTITMCSLREKEGMSEFLNRTIHFGRIALKEMRCFESANTNIFLNLMNRSIEAMAIESAGLNEISFSEDYLYELEKFSPLHFDYVRRKKSQSKSQRFALFQKYFEQTKSGSMVNIY